MEKERIIIPQCACGAVKIKDQIVRLTPEQLTSLEEKGVEMSHTTFSRQCLIEYNKLERQEAEEILPNGPESCPPPIT